MNCLSTEKCLCTEKDDAEVSENLARYRFKNQNNYVGHFKLVARISKFFATLLIILKFILYFLHYFDYFGLIKLFLDLYLVKFLDISNHMSMPQDSILFYANQSRN